MAKELTNRQLAEILGYALEKAEKNIKQSADTLENERKRIENFSIDTESAESVFKEANERFKESIRICVSELKKVQETKPKWLQMKDYLLIGVLALLTICSLGLAISLYYKQSKLEEENVKLNNVVSNLSDFFQENAKERKTFEEWKSK